MGVVFRNGVVVNMVQIPSANKVSGVMQEARNVEAVSHQHRLGEGLNTEGASLAHRTMRQGEQ